uniref:Uncharacterized protein n=1 Tax=Arion vulgaris TaxID=1028688 RepID=A0A0B6ZRB3_9EUPU
MKYYNTKKQQHTLLTDDTSGHVLLSRVGSDINENTYVSGGWRRVRTLEKK